MISDYPYSSSAGKPTQKPVDRIDQQFLDMMRRAASAGIAERRNLPSGLPPIHYGTTQWAFTNRGVGEELRTLGWEVEYVDNQPRFYPPDRGFAITASSGDRYVGDSTRKARKFNIGPVSRRSEYNNRLMQSVLDGFGPMLISNPKPIVPIATLLYHNHEKSGELRMELTFLGSENFDPERGWINRFFLDPVILDDDFEFLIGVDDEPDVDFDVSSRQQS